MSDATMARLARDLARALIRFAHERDDGSKKRVAELHTELCAALRAEENEDAKELQ